MISDCYTLWYVWFAVIEPVKILPLGNSFIPVVTKMYERDELPAVLGSEMYE